MKTSHIMCKLKILTDLYFTKQKRKIKNTFARVVYSENVLKEHEELCLSINGAQSVDLKREQLSLKIILNKYQFLLNLILILSVI